MEICKKHRPFNHIFSPDRIWEHDIEASKMQGCARGRKGERTTYWMWQKAHARESAQGAKRKGSYHNKIIKDFLPTSICFPIPCSNVAGYYCVFFWPGKATPQVETRGQSETRVCADSADSAVLKGKPQQWRRVSNAAPDPKYLFFQNHGSGKLP